MSLTVECFYFVRYYHVLAKFFTSLMVEAWTKDYG